jgi:DNA-nicking Smr family endonuclease
MATAVNITLQSVCAGQNHLHMSVTVGNTTREYTFEADEVLAPITEEMIRGTIVTVLRLHLRGMTRLQARNTLQAGVNLSI